MLRAMWGFALIGLVVVMAGCGGGGGAGVAAAPPQGSSMLPANLTGDWTVRSLGLPGDRISVEGDGQVVVSTSASRGTVTIGSCAQDGTLSLSGAWSSGGENYSINGSGAINPNSGSISVRATVLEGDTPIYQDALVNGVKASSDGFDVPPPPPATDDEGSGQQDGYDAPPPPPDLDSDSTQETIDLPPPPPAYD